MDKRKQLYDELSDLITEYEEFNDFGNDTMDYIDWADNLYQMLVRIQNEWETTITVV